MGQFLRSNLIKSPTIPPCMPGRGVVGLNIDRCIYSSEDFTCACYTFPAVPHKNFINCLFCPVFILQTHLCTHSKCYVCLASRHKYNFNWIKVHDNINFVICLFLFLTLLPFNVVLLFSSYFEAINHFKPLLDVY